VTRVAVIVPCYDDGETLPETLASLRSQEEHELVVVDDGSRDPATLELLAALERDGTRIARRANGGLSAARVTGLHATSAPYVFPLDADDLLEEGALTRLADALDADPELAVAWGDVRLFGAKDLQLRMPETLDPWLLTYVNEIPGTSLLRRSAVEAAGGWRLAGGYEDWDLWLSFVERGFRGRYVPGPMLRYRQSHGRMNASAIEQHEAKWPAVRELHRDLFARRRALARRSPEAGYVKLLWPLVEAIPWLSLWRRHQLCRLVRDPLRQLASRRRSP
jgi:glycosyltransferase involved in cell wall biosynthesis